MELANILLTVVLVTLLIAGPVESTGGKESGSTGELVKLEPKISTLLAPSTLQIKGPPAPARGRRNKKKKKKGKKKNRSPKVLTVQDISPVQVVDSNASSPEVKLFVEAVQISDMLAAFNIFHSYNTDLKEYCGKHLVSLGSLELVELINRAGQYIKGWMLQVILVHAEQQLIDEVFDMVKPSNILLRDVAASEDLACVPQRFTYLLNQIDDKEFQKRAVEYGVFALFRANRTECLDPLFTTLNEGTFLSKDLENIAVCKAFWAASICNDGRTLVVKRYFDHPAISADGYSNVLYAFYINGGQIKELFHWLLLRADRQDLEIAQKSDNLSMWGTEFRQAVNRAAHTVGPVSRHEIRRPERIALMKEALENVIPKDLLNIIAEY